MEFLVKKYNFWLFAIWMYFLRLFFNINPYSNISETFQKAALHSLELISKIIFEKLLSIGHMSIFQTSLFFRISVILKSHSFEFGYHLVCVHYFIIHLILLRFSLMLVFLKSVLVINIGKIWDFCTYIQIVGILYLTIPSIPLCQFIW
jgi:hypothetical protein